MPNFFDTPFAWPFKMVPVSNNPGIHFDDDWARNQVKSFEYKAFYKQKWVTTDTTPLQLTSSLPPEDMKIYDINMEVAKTIAWTAVFTAVNYRIYELDFDISDLDEGVYFIFQQVTFGAIDWQAISEPIHSKATWKNTLLFTYWNSFNDFDIAWSTGIKMKFRCEAGIKNRPEFFRGATDYVNQVKDKTVLSGYPSRQFKLDIGDEKGVAPYIVDILNMIFVCDNVDIQGKKYTADADKWDIVDVKGYPLVGASIDIVPSKNVRSLQFSDTAPLAEGIVTAYEIQTGFFGPAAAVPVTEVEENS